MQNFSTKYFLKVAFVREISPKLAGGLGATGMNRLNMSDHEYAPYAN